MEERAVTSSSHLRVDPAQDPRRDELARLWPDVLRAVRETIRREQFETWFGRTALVGKDEDSVSVAVHNRFTRDWLLRYYTQVLEDAFEAVLGSRRRVELVVDPHAAAEAAPLPFESSDEENEGTVLAPLAPARPAPPAEGAQLHRWSDLSLNPEYRFETFVVGPCNRFAHAACTGVAESPGKAYNPLFLHGHVGLGKTHLLQSLCRSVLDGRHGRKNVLYFSCETFINHFISALDHGDIEAFRNKYRNVDVLVVDDIQLLANKERTQEEFFHTFNALYLRGGQIVLSSDRPALEIPTLQDRLISRFRWGLVTELEPPCYETRMAILRRKSRERGRELPESVARFLAERIDTNVRELEGAVTKVLTFAALHQREIDLHLVRQVLRELFAIPSGQASIEDVMNVVTARFGVKLPELQSRKRTNAIAFPRHIGMYLARRITRMSLTEIGGYFGGRDHATVLYGIRKITKLAREDARCQDLLVELLLELQGNAETDLF